jgi:hypothetical protein
MRQVVEVFSNAGETGNAEEVQATLDLDDG